MMHEKQASFYSSASPTQSTSSRTNQANSTPPDNQPRRPDWLVLFMCALFLVALLIAWLVDIPALLHA